MRTIAMRTIFFTALHNNYFLQKVTSIGKLLTLLVTVFLSAYSTNANAQVLGDPSVISGNVHEIVHLVAGDGRKVEAVLMYPDTGIDQYSPAIVFHHGGFGGHPARQVGAPRFAAERLAAKGYTVLSLLSRQSNGHIDSLFEESQKDIKAGIDFLANRGMQDIILAAHSLGSIRISGYLADNKDPRVKAAVHYAPTADMSDAQRKSLGDEAYEERVRKAQEAVAAGKGRLDLGGDPDLIKGLESDPVIDFGFTFQTPAAYLSWWGPDARTSNTDRFADTEVPILMLSGTEDSLVPQGRMKQLKKAAIKAPAVDYIWYQDGDHFFSGFQDQAAADTANWLAKQGLGVKTPITTRLVDTLLASGRYFPGVLYSPKSGADKSKPVFIIQHGYTGNIFQTSNHWLSTRLAQEGFTVLAPMTRSSGLTGIVKGKMQNMVEDMGAWVDFLEQQGYSQVVTVGHSLGGIWTALYVSQSQDQRIKAMVFMAPTRSMPGSSERSLGAERYAEINARAEALVAEGKGKTMITDKYYRKPPAPKGARSMYFQQAESWLDSWGKGSVAVLTDRLSEIDLPMLSLAGSKDLYVDEAYMHEVQAAAAGPMELVWYGGKDGANHGFNDYEDRVAEDILSWMQSISLSD